MILISLMLAAAPAPLLKPDAGQAREAIRSRADRLAVRSKRLIELEAAVRSLPRTAAEPDRSAGPKGM